MQKEKESMLPLSSAQGYEHARNWKPSALYASFFKSVGVAVQDAAAAHLALQKAQALGMGQRVRW